MRARQFARYAWRESRGSLGRLGFFVACLAVGVGAVVAVAGLSDGLAGGVGREARQLLAADLVIESREPPSPELVATLEREVGGERATLKEMVTVVSAGDTPANAPATSQLVELKSVEGGYPFYGVLSLEPTVPLGDLLRDDATVVAPDLLARLELDVGDPLRIGSVEFEITGVVLGEPDRVGTALTAGPRVFVSSGGLARADLERFGSRITYRTLVRIPDGPSGAMSREALDALAGRIRDWPGIGTDHRVVTYAEAQPAVRRSLRRVDRFLGLVALLSLLLGGVGVAQTTRAWLEGRIDAMAILRAIGFRPNEVFLLYLGQTAILGLLGSIAGVALGTAALAVIPALIADLLPAEVTIDPWQPRAAVRGLVLGLGIAGLFCWGPLVTVRRVPPLRALRKDAEPLRASRWTRLLLAGALFAGVTATATIQARSLALGASFAVGLAVAAAALAGLSHSAIRAVGRLPRGALGGAPVWLRQGLAAPGRPGSGSVGAAVALGLGVLIILGMVLVERGLTRQLSTALPAGAPSAFLIDIQRSQWSGVQEILAAEGVESVSSAPVVTARIAGLDGRSVDELLSEAGRGDTPGAERWALRREQRVTYLDALAPDNVILETSGAGALWSDPDVAELSVEEDYAADLGLELGSRVELDVQGVPVELTVTSIRSVDWGTFDLNFFFVAEPEALVDAPQYRVATVRLPPGGEQLVQDRLAAAFPNVTMIRIRDVLAKIRGVLERLALAVQLLGGFTVVAGLVILTGAVSAGSIRRGREIAILKTLGMVRRDVGLMFTVEFALVGLLAGIVGAAGGVLLAHSVLTRGMEIAWSFEPIPVVVAVTAAIALSAGAALLAGWRALAVRPLEVLRGD